MIDVLFIEDQPALARFDSRAGLTQAVDHRRQVFGFAAGDFKTAAGNGRCDGQNVRKCPKTGDLANAHRRNERTVPEFLAGMDVRQVHLHDGKITIFARGLEHLADRVEGRLQAMREITTGTRIYYSAPDYSKFKRD